MSGWLDADLAGVDQLLRLVHRRADVLRHADGSADPARADGQRHGAGPRAGAPAGRPGAFAAEHAGDQLDPRAEEDADLRRARGGRDGDDHGDGFRSMISEIGGAS